MRFMTALTALAMAATQVAAANLFEQPLTQIQDLTIGPGEPAGLVIDPVDGIGYLGNDTAPGKISLFRLATQTEPAAFLHTIDLQPGENYPDTLIVDSARGYLYIGCYTNPAILIKFRLNEPGAAPTRIGTLTLEPDEDSIASAAVDHAANTAYIGLDQSPARIVKVHLGDGDPLPTRIGRLTLNPGETSGRGGGPISPARGKLWLATQGTPVKFVQVSLGAPGQPPSRDTAIEVPLPGTNVPIAFDPLTEAAFVPSFSPTARILKFSVAASEPQFLGFLTYDGPNESNLLSITVAPTVGLGFALSFTDPVAVLRFATGGSFDGPGRIGVVHATAPNFGPLNSVAYDSRTGLLYVGTTAAGMTHILVFSLQFNAGPDLTGQLASLKVSGKPGKFRARARLTETNIGTADAGLHLVRFFLSDDPILDAHDIQIAPDRPIKKLKPGKSRRLPINSPTLATSPSGKYIIAHIDRNSLSGDVNPGNNVVISAPLP